MPHHEKVPGWPGYVRVSGGVRTFIIEKRVGGVKYHVSTRCHALRPAMAQLEEFETNPSAYVERMKGRAPAQRPATGSLLLTAELILDFERWMRARPRPASDEWARTVANFLSHWADDLAGLDLRDVSVQRNLKPALDKRRTSRRHRIEAIKSFYGWMRKEQGLLAHHEDPTADLPVPQAAPEKHTRRKVIPEESLAKVLPLLPPELADVVTLQSGTGWHLSEVRRFASIGEMVKPPPGYPGIKVVLRVPHKSGDVIPTPLQHDEHVEAAQRILARGSIPSRFQIARLMREACDEARVPRFRLGWMRHTVGTRAVEMGATPQEVSEFLGHRSLATTKRFYLDVSVPTVSVPVMRLLKGGRP